jgi:hypothetical protein
MIVRKEEFLALKQGPLSVSEYRDKFLQLSRYAPEDVNTDAKRQYHFLRGLVDPLHYQLMNHTFPTFQHLIDRAIIIERKHQEMENRKCKIGGSQVGSSSRPRYSGNPPQHFKQGHPQGHQHQRRTNSSSTRGSFLSNSSSIVKATSRDKISISVRTTRQLAFLPQQPTRTTKQPHTSRRLHMLLLWRTKPLGEELSKGSSSAVASSQYPNKTRSTTASTRRSWSGLQPWKGEPPGGRSNIGCSGRGSRYVSSQIPSSKSIILHWCHTFFCFYIMGRST